VPTSFYETVVFDPTAETLLGVQVLTSPPSIPAARHLDYTPLLDDADRRFTLGDEPDSASDPASVLQPVIAALADPNFDWERFLDFGFLDRLNESGAVFRVPAAMASAYDFAGALLESETVAAETSPLRKRDIATLAAGSSLVGVFVFGGIPMLVFVGAEVGLVVIRGLSAFSGAIWRGAEPEVEEFGGDAAAKLLDAIRRRLNIERRKKSPGDLG
jgi:hypothetical protein